MRALLLGLLGATAFVTAFQEGPERVRPTADDPFRRAGVFGRTADFRELRDGAWMLGFFSLKMA